MLGENLFVEEYTLLEQIHIFAGVFDTFSVLYPQPQRIDFREDATSLDVPVYLVPGRHEARGRAVLADEWYAELRAPASQTTGTGRRPRRSSASPSNEKASKSSRWGERCSAPTAARARPRTKGQERACGGGASVNPVGYIEMRDGPAQLKRIPGPVDVLAFVAATSLAALTINRLLDA